MGDKVSVPFLKDGVFTGKASSDIDGRIKKSVDDIGARLTGELGKKVDLSDFINYTTSVASAGRVSDVSVQAGMIRIGFDNGLDISAPLPNARTYSPVTYFWADWYNNEKSKWLQATKGMPVGYVILNIGNGSGESVDADFTEQVKRVRTSGARVLGYVRTDYGKRSQAKIMQEIRNHVSWYRVDGVFLDEALNGWGDQEPLIASQVKLYGDIKKEFGDSFTVVTNPGANTVQALIDASDVQMCFESYAETYLTTTFPEFYKEYPAHRFWHVVHDVTQANYKAVLDRATVLNAGHLYVTDDKFKPSTSPQAPAENPYDAVPSAYLLEAQKYWVEGLSELVDKITSSAAPVDLSAYATNAEVATKTSKTYVDAGLAKKADTTTMNAELAKKVDKTTKLVANVTLNGKVFTVTYSNGTTSTLTLA